MMHENNQTDPPLPSSPKMKKHKQEESIIQVTILYYDLISVNNINFVF